MTGDVEDGSRGVREKPWGSEFAALWRKWGWPKWPVAAVVGLTAVLIVGLTVVGVVFAVVTFVTLVHTGADRTRHWAEITGPIGDTFGGVLGPLLNALVLVTTVYIAVSFQPRWAEKVRLRVEEQRRAADVVGWIAETEDHRYIGVVVTNEADSVVHAVDIGVTTDGGEAPDTDRETIVPPGTWFIPFKAVQGDLGNTDAGDLGWRLPVPVRRADGMEVSLERLGANDDDPVVTTLFLRPHVPGERGEARVHYTLSEFRYVLHGRSWERTDEGRTVNADPLNADETVRRAGLAGKARGSARVETASRRVGEDVERLIQYTFDQLCDPGQLERARRPGVKNPLRGPLGVREGALPGIDTMERPTNGGRVQFNLEEPADAHLWIAQVNDSYPATVRLRGAEDARFLIDGRRADGLVAKAGAAVRGLSNGYELARPAAEWLKTEKSRREWIQTLTQMVGTASRAVHAPSVARQAEGDVPLIGTHES